MLHVAENVATKTPVLVNADAPRKFVAVGTVSRAGFWVGKGCSITFPISTWWVHAPSPEPSIFGSIERFVVRGAAPDILCDAQLEVPDLEDGMFLFPPLDRHPTLWADYMPNGHTQQLLILNGPFVLDAQDAAEGTVHSWNCVGWTNIMPTTVALQRMLSWVPTLIALWPPHVLWFTFRHTQVWVWAPCWPLKDFAKRTAPWSTCLRQTRKNVASPTRRATQQSVE